jgi:ABC-type sugar transport system ATPase subunit
MNLVPVERKGDRIEGPLGLPAPEWLPEGTLAVGFRPEHVRLGGEPAGALCASTRVVASEPLGAETFVHLDASGTALRARVEGFGTLEPGSDVELSVPDDRLLWFDSGGTRLVGGA